MPYFCTASPRVRRIVMEDMLRRLAKHIVDEPVLIKLIQEELEKKDILHPAFEKYPDENKPGLSRVLITDDCRIYFLDYKHRELELQGYQARALYLFYLLSAKAVSNEKLESFRPELIEIYMEICKDRQFDIFRAEMVINGLFNRKGGIPDATNNIRLALSKVVTDKQLIKEYIISGKRKDDRGVRLSKKLIRVENKLLRGVMDKLLNKEI